MIETTKTTFGKLYGSLSPIPNELHTLSRAAGGSPESVVYVKWRVAGDSRHFLSASSQPPAGVIVAVPQDGAVLDSETTSGAVVLTPSARVRIGSGKSAWTVEEVAPDGVSLSLNGRHRFVVDASRLSVIES